MTDSPRSSRTEAGPAVAVHGLTKTFSVPLHPARGIVAVRDLNLRIEPGEVYGFLGPNGFSNAWANGNFWARQSPRGKPGSGRFSTRKPVFLQVFDRRRNAVFLWA